MDGQTKTNNNIILVEFHRSYQENPSQEKLETMNQIGRPLYPKIVKFNHVFKE